MKSIHIVKFFSKTTTFYHKNDPFLDPLGLNLYKFLGITDYTKEHKVI